MTELNGQAQDWKEIHERFENEVDEVDADRFEDLVEMRIDNEEDELQFYEQYLTEKEAHERRFILRSTLITAFAHRGAFFDTEWAIEGQFVFREEEFGPADLLVAESQDNGSIAILAVAMKSEDENIFERVQRLCDYISNNISSIETDLNTVLSGDVAGAIALFDVEPDHVRHATETAESENSDWSPVSVWELQSGDDDGASERLTIATWDDTDHPLDFVPGGGLGTELQNEGLALIDTKRIQIDRFSDSHHEKIFKNLYVWLFNRHAGRDKTNSYFSKEELITFLTESADQPTRQDIHPRAQQLIDWWYEMDMIESAPNPKNYDDDMTVHSISVPMRTGDMSDETLEQYRAAAVEEFIKKDLRERYNANGGWDDEQ